MEIFFKYLRAIKNTAARDFLRLSALNFLLFFRFSHLNKFPVILLNDARQISLLSSFFFLFFFFFLSFRRVYRVKRCEVPVDTGDDYYDYIDQI